MTYNLDNYFTSLVGLIEYLFIIGLHEEALGLAKLSNNQTLAEELNNAYKINYSDLCSKMDRTQSTWIKRKDFCLLPQEEYEFLYYSASKLSPNSKILEIGTYLGGSTSALCEGSSENNSEVTTIDVYQGFNQENKNLTLHQPLNWDYNYWQTNTREFSNRIRSIRGSATNSLRRLAREGERFDLIFLDTAHQTETYFELSLISCVASNNCILIADDIINFSNLMTSVWALGLKNFLCHPRFFNKFAIANFKDDSTPFNFKYEATEGAIATLRNMIRETLESKEIELLSFD